MTNNNIIFDSEEIDQCIKNSQNNIYIKDKNTALCFISEKVKKEKNQKYFVNIKRDKEHYIGVLTDNFKRDLFGFISFNNGDEYYGDISNEMKNGFGIYLYNMQKEGPQKIYIGNFTNNAINGEGIYIDILEKKKSGKKDDIELIRYNCYIGQFIKGKFIKGKKYTYIKDNFEKLLIQSEDGKAFIIETQNQNNNISVSKGIMKNGEFINGIIINMIKDNIVLKLSFTKKDGTNCEFKTLNNTEEENKIIEEFNNYKQNYTEYNKTMQQYINDDILWLIGRYKSNIYYASSCGIENNIKKSFINEKYNFLLFK